MAASGVAPAHALPGGNFFELDGNAVHNASTTPPYDWAQLQTFCDALSTPACPTGVAAATGIINDLPADLSDPNAITDTTFFSGGGSKDDLDITSWGTGGHGAPDKNELTNAYAAASRDSAGDLIVYFGADRYDTSGAAEMGFWLLKGTVRPNSGTFVDENHNPAVHQVGDVLVLTDFTTGGQLGEIIVYKWVGPGGAGGTDGSNNSLQLLQKSVAPKPTKANPNPANPADCTSPPTTANLTFCGVINRTDQTAPWPYKNKSAAGNHSTTTFPPFSFMEGAVNIKALTGGDCFASYLAETRTAPEIQGAELKDFALRDFQPCLPSTTMKNTAMTSNATQVGGVGTVHLGQSVTYTAYEKNDGTDPLTAPVGGFVTGTGCSPWTNTGGDTNSNGKLDPGEEWSFTCTTSYSTPGTKTVTVVGHGLDPRFGNKDVTVCATPDSTKICDPDETNTISILVISPNTSLQATAATATPATIHSGESSTLAFYETNTGDTVLTNPHVDTDLTGTTCATTTYVSGDTNGDGKLDPGETFKFTCSTTFAATTTVTAVGHGTDPLGRDITTPGYPLETTTVTVTVINPDTTLTTTANAAITYTFREANSGDSVITSPHVTVAAGTCDAAPAYVSGDTNNNGVLDLTETWVFSCTHTLTGPTADTGSATTFVDAHGHGYDATGADVTKCPSDEATTPPRACRSSGSEADRTDVTITNSARN